jgi:NAD(P)H-dependent FMN reductase
MSENPLRTAVIVGSVREGRLAPLVNRWFVGQAAQRDDITLDVIDLADIGLRDGLRGHFSGERPPEVTALGSRLADAEAFVVVTPEYNRGYPAALKVAIDSFHTQWQAKPVGFVSYGGFSGGLRAVEQLRSVFAELSATCVRDSVAFREVWARFDAEGNWPKDPESCDAAAKIMLDQLVWWGLALRDARAVRPYAG